jgi:hypothetical protein
MLPRPPTTIITMNSIERVTENESADSVRMK